MASKMKHKQRSRKSYRIKAAAYQNYLRSGYFYQNARSNYGMAK